METVGVYLKKEREAKNISLREVSRLTKISESYLDYIEKDDYEKLPQGPYIKGYISTYSRFIGGDVDEALKLYDSLYRQRNQTEEIQPEVSKDKGWKASIGASLNSIVSSLNNKKNNGQNHPPEKPKANVRKASTTSLMGKIGSSFNNVASSVKAKSASLKAAAPPLKTIFIPFKKIPTFLKASGSKLKAAVSSFSMLMVSLLKTADASIKTIGPSIKKKSASLKNIVPIFKKAASAVTTNRWLAHRRTWLYGLSLFGAGILVLAGLGLYNLFIDDGHPPIVAESQILQGKEKAPTPDMGAGKKVLPSRSNDASGTSKKLNESANKKGLSTLLGPPADQKHRSSLSANPDAKVSRETSSTERSNNASKPVDPVSTPSSSSSLPAENAVSSRTIAGKESSAPSGQGLMTASPLPGSTAAVVNLNVLKASICSEIKNRMPAGVDTSFPSSVKRVYVWSLIEARQIPSKIRHIYYFKDQKISDVTLNVRSSYWRTWSFKSISRDRYRGKWRVDIASTDGKVLRRLYFEIN